MDLPPLRYGTVSIAPALSIRYRITKYCGGRMNDDSGHRTWIDAGLKELGRGGVASDFYFGGRNARELALREAELREVTVDSFVHCVERL